MEDYNQDNITNLNWLLLSRSLAKETEYIEEMVETSTGRVLVAHTGDRSKPVRISTLDFLTECSF